LHPITEQLPDSQIKIKHNINYRQMQIFEAIDQSISILSQFEIHEFVIFKPKL